MQFSIPAKARKDGGGSAPPAVKRVRVADLHPIADHFARDRRAARRLALLVRWAALVDEVLRLDDDVARSGDFRKGEKAALRSALDSLWTTLEWTRPRMRFLYLPRRAA